MESASKSTGLFLNPSKTKYMHINPSANDSVHSSDGSQIEKVEDFKYLGSYTNSQHDIQCKKALAWAAVHALDKVWRATICRLTKLKIFKMMFEPILIYECDSWSVTQSIENALDGTYTRMQHKNQNVCMAPPHDQSRTVRLPPTDHHHRETTASLSGRSCDAP